MSGQDLFIVVHEKVYDATKFVDEHPYALPLSLLAIWQPLPLRGTFAPASTYAVCVDEKIG